MAEAAGPDWTAMTQAVSAVVQGIGVLVTLYLTHRLAKKGQEDAKQRDDSDTMRQERTCEALLVLLNDTSEKAFHALRDDKQHELHSHLHVLQATLRRADRTSIDRLASPAMWHFFAALDRSARIEARIAGLGSISIEAIGEVGAWQLELSACVACFQDAICAGEPGADVEPVQ